ncbi:MAG TPA: M56 and DUF3738 domain-containing protein, partial [Gemmatimonadales bacterium]|nr:M56 and DUF3738 domain-containing protein [Gemmatimonadales bacterium]
PGVFGVFRPVLLLPEGIADRLTPAQLKAILAHELCHVRRRDNLAAVMHMVVEAVFWFHPLVWWIGARLVEERERACDEEVLRLGSQPEVYAAGILNVCKFYLESPLPCAAGVTGSDLEKRIEAIMTHRILPRLTPARKIVLASAGIAAVAGPICIGIVKAPSVRAQSQTGAGASLTTEANLRFEVASIKPASPTDAGKAGLELLPGGGLRVTNVTLRQLITFAYEVQDLQVSGGPGWLGSERYDILAKPEHSAGTSGMAISQGRAAGDRVRQRTRSLLAERFQLVIHKDAREGPVLALVVAKNGPKIQPSKQGEEIPPGTRRSEAQIDARRGTMGMLAAVLANWLRRPVVDRTGLTGNYDYTVKYAPDTAGPAARGALGGPETNQADITGPSIFSALQEQLGLKLESARGPVEVIVIDRAERPSAN